MSRDDADLQAMGFRSSDELRDFQRLPELPEPTLCRDVVSSLLGPDLVEPLFTADQMHAYALADRASRPVGDGGADMLLRVIQRLNANPYSLTKAECISEVEDMLRAARTAGTDTAGGASTCPHGTPLAFPCDLCVAGVDPHLQTR